MTTRTTPTMRSFIRASLKEKSFFFSESTMQFFGSQVHGEFHQISTDEPHRGYFITSEQDDEDGAWNGQRRYTVRYAQSPTEISDFSEFGQYVTYEEALNAVVTHLSLAGIGNT